MPKKANIFDSSTIMLALSSIVSQSMVMPTPAGKAYLQTMPGITAPFGFFDPMGLTDDITMEEAKLFREAELAHGRVAMMGALGFLVQENFHPIFADIDGPAARQLDLVLKTSNGQLVSSCLLLGIFLSEIGRANFGWHDPDVAMRTLRTEYSPGELSFDPLNMMPKDEAGIAAMKNKELNNGRLAMLAVAGIVAQEVVTEKTLFGSFV